MGLALPTAQFTTERLPPSARYEAWRTLFSAVFEPKPARAGHADLQARASAVHLGQVLVLDVAAEAQSFTRSQRHIAAEGLDHLVVQVYRRGGSSGIFGEVQNTTRPADIKLFDLGRPLHSSNTDFENTSLTIPRGLLAPLLARPDGLHGRVLPGETATAKILAAHLLALSAQAERLTGAEAAALGSASVRLVAACLGANPRAQEETRPYRAAGMSQLVREFIERSLADPGLTPDALAVRFRMSRAHIYRLFVEDGGIAAYIRARRLRACYLRITDPVYSAERIGDIAFRFGFTSEAHFSRAFRSAFGLSPSEARAIRQTAGDVPGAAADTFISDWMRGLCRGVGDALRIS